jgi:hypothetical protein
VAQQSPGLAGGRAGSALRHIFGNATFNLAVYAVPVLAGVAAGLFGYRTGAGLIGAVAIAAGAGVVTLVIGQFIFATIRSRLLKNLVAAAFTLPAAVAGYHLVLGLSTLGTSAHSARSTTSFRARSRP